MRTEKKSARVEVYLFFNGRCEEALSFYQSKLGAEVLMKMRFKDSPEPANCPPGAGENIMHAAFRIGETMVMASDGCGSGPEKFERFALSLGVNDEAEARRAFTALSDGGNVTMPLTKTFWSPLFGMVADKFGVLWMINVLGPNA